MATYRDGIRTQVTNTGELGDGVTVDGVDISARIESLELSVSSSGIQTAVFSNDATEVTLFSLTIPANTLQFGNYVLLRSVNEVVSLISGELRQRVWLGPVGGTGLISGYLPRNSVGRSGFEFNGFAVIDSGSGPTSARFVSSSFSGVDVVADITQDIVVNFTGQMTVADASNSFRGCSAHLRAL